MIEKVNIMCMKWGTKFGPEYVNRLYHMVERNITIPHRFVCFTDDTNGLEPGIETFPMPEIHVPKKNQYSPWRKLTILGETLGDLKGTTLFLDLDVLIVANIDSFFMHPGKFCIIENWTQMGEGVGNSSVYRFEVGAHKDVLEYYNNNTDEVVTKYDNEQIFLSKHIAEKEGEITFWPYEWCASFKRNCVPAWPLRYFIEPKIPKNTKIVVFHGHPTPEEAAKGEWPGKGMHKFIKPVTWVAKYWK